MFFLLFLFFFFFFNDTATTEIYTLSLHDALPIWISCDERVIGSRFSVVGASLSSRSRRSAEQRLPTTGNRLLRSEEHTSELQSQSNLVCRLLLEKKKKKKKKSHIIEKTQINTSTQ